MAVKAYKNALVMQITLIGLLILVSSAKNAVWQNDIHLWEDAVKKSPNRAGVHYNLGNVYLKEGRKTIIKLLIFIGGLW